MKKYNLVVLAICCSAVLESVPAIAKNGDGVSLNKEIKQEIVHRCRETMSEYGSSLVKSCVDDDSEAYIKLMQYPEDYNMIVERCLKTMKNYGYSMVLSCAEDDIEAEEALDEYLQ